MLQYSLYIQNEWTLNCIYTQISSGNFTYFNMNALGILEKRTFIPTKTHRDILILEYLLYATKWYIL